MGKKRDHKKTKAPVMEKPGIVSKIPNWGLSVLLFLCPLLFFTNLTRNPYYTQIAILNIAIALFGLYWAIDAWRKGVVRLPRVSFEIPLLAFLIVAFLSTLMSWQAHEFVRSGIVYEGIRVWVFTLVNSVMAFYLPLLFVKPVDQETPTLSIWPDIIFAFVWGLMWFGFHSMKSPTPTSYIWDAYGGFLWVIGMAYAILRIKDGHMLRVLHVVFVVALLAGGYGLMQYMGRDIIWGSPVQPYGGRPVSTFGNPNFMSSFLLMVCPLATVMGFQAKGKEAGGYFFVAVICILSALGTLTRSTIVGLFATYVFLAIALYRKDHLRYVKWAGLALGLILLVVLIFPSTPVKSVQSPLARFTEIFDAIESGKPYAPWHQRILIWSSAWDMLLERPILGKGWGTFELFYPFYQGKYILVDLFAQFRTHANNAHNVLLEMLAQLGFLGTGFSLLVIVSLFWGAWLSFRAKAEGTSRFLMAALLAGFVGMMVDNFFGNVSIFFAVPAFLFWWNMGTLYNEADEIRVIQRPLTNSVGKPLMIFFMIFCLAVSVYFYRRWKQETYYFLGFKDTKNGKLENSYKNLETAYSWFEGEVNSNYEMGNSYARFSQLMSRKKLEDQALKFREKSRDGYEAALKANPGYDEIYYNLGVVYSQLGDRAKAYRNIEMALYINPLLKDAYSTLGRLYLQDEKYAEATRIFENGLASFPKDKQMWLNLGFVYVQQGQNESTKGYEKKAHDAFRRAYLLDPQFKQAWSNLKLVTDSLGVEEPLLEAPILIQDTERLVKEKKFPEALKRAERMMTLFPENADAKLSVGNILFYLGRRDEAIEVVKAALDLNPRLVQAHANLGSMYKFLKKNDLARASFQAALKIDPKNVQAKEGLSNLPQ